MQKYAILDYQLFLFFKFERKNEFFRSFLYYFFNNYWNNLLSNKKTQKVELMN